MELLTSTLPSLAYEHTLITGSVVLSGLVPFVVVAYAPGWLEVSAPFEPASIVTVTVWGTPQSPGRACVDFVAWPTVDWKRVCLDVLNVNEPPVIVGVEQTPRVCLVGHECTLWARYEDPDMLEVDQPPPQLSTSFPWLEGPSCAGDVCYWRGRYGLGVEHSGVVMAQDEEYEASFPYVFRRPLLLFLPAVFKR